MSTWLVIRGIKCRFPRHLITPKENKCNCTANAPIVKLICKGICLTFLFMIQFFSAIYQEIIAILTMKLCVRQRARRLMTSLQI